MYNHNISKLKPPNKFTLVVKPYIFVDLNSSNILQLSAFICYCCRSSLSELPLHLIYISAAFIRNPTFTATGWINLETGGRWSVLNQECLWSSICGVLCDFELDLTMAGKNRNEMQVHMWLTLEHRLLSRQVNRARNGHQSHLQTVWQGGVHTSHHHKLLLCKRNLEEGNVTIGKSRREKGNGEIILV
jgi:hypothetical protein